jgi:hypothetical protein
LILSSLSSALPFLPPSYRDADAFQFQPPPPQAMPFSLYAMTDAIIFAIATPAHTPRDDFFSLAIVTIYAFMITRFFVSSFSRTRHFRQSRIAPRRYAISPVRH